MLEDLILEKHRDALTLYEGPEVDKSKLYTQKDIEDHVGELALHVHDSTISTKGQYDNLHSDYIRSRMLLTSCMTELDSQKKYITRLEKLNDTLLGRFQDV